MARLYRTDGTVEEVRPLNGRAFSLGELQTLVGGYVQVVGGFDGRVIVCDEDGKLKGKPVNLIASSFWAGTTFGDPLVGEILMTTWDEMKGDDKQCEEEDGIE